MPSNFEFEMTSYFNQRNQTQASIQPVSVQLVQPGLYSLQNFKKDDRTQMCNLDRFIEATIPTGFNICENTVKNLIDAYHSVSIHGLKVALQDLEVQYVCTFVPTLSSVYFMTKSQKGSKCIESHEEQPPFKRKPMSLALKDAI